MALFEVVLEDSDGSRQWRDPVTAEPTNESVLVVEAKDAAAAKEFAEQQNPGLTAREAKKSD